MQLHTLHTSLVERAHPLYPPQQAFLWLPGIGNFGVPYCSFNGRPSVAPSESSAEVTLPAPPYPVSPATFTVWHFDVIPPQPYHPIPLKQPLTHAEMERLARRVTELLGQSDHCDDPMSVLRNSWKCHVVLALREMDLLATGTPRGAADGPDSTSLGLSTVGSGSATATKRPVRRAAVMKPREAAMA